MLYQNWRHELGNILNSFILHTPFLPPFLGPEAFF
nr:MAG TPA: hypothetical protein [Caudoviricetes sp.]